MSFIRRRRSSSTGLSPLVATELTDSVVIVVFGASGDLAKKKTVCNLFIYID